MHAPVPPEKQKYLDRCAKRAKLRAKVYKPVETRKQPEPFVPTGNAPCAFMVERVKAEVDGTK